MTIVFTILSGILGYLLGSINSSIIVTKIMTGKDVRDIGSGNAGATNTLRAAGKKGAVLVLLGDMLKGVLALLLVKIFANIFTFDQQIPLYFASICVVLGHIFPLYYGFRGGKGVATSAAIVIMLNPIIGLIVFVSSIAVMAITKYVSVGSIFSGILYVILTLIFNNNVYSVVFSVVLASLIIFMHRGNIKRLLNGTENKLGRKDR